MVADADAVVAMPPPGEGKLVEQSAEVVQLRARLAEAERRAETAESKAREAAALVSAALPAKAGGEGTPGIASEIGVLSMRVGESGDVEVLLMQSREVAEVNPGQLQGGRNPVLRIMVENKKLSERVEELEARSRRHTEEIARLAGRLEAVRPHAHGGPEFELMHEEGDEPAAPPSRSFTRLVPLRPSVDEGQPLAAGVGLLPAPEPAARPEEPAAPAEARRGEAEAPAPAPSGALDLSTWPAELRAKHERAAGRPAGSRPPLMTSKSLDLSTWPAEVRAAWAGETVEAVSAPEPTQPLLPRPASPARSSLCAIM